MNFKIVLIIAFFLLCSRLDAYSQDSQDTDSAKYTKFLPDYVKLQFAGGIGFLSLGLGYTFFDHRLDVSFFYGYVPIFISIDDLHSVSLQLTGKLIRIKVNEDIDLLPLNIGFFIHHTFGNEYWISLPSHYPDEYYWWAPGRNAGLFIGGEIKTKLLSDKTPASGTAFYVRVGSRGLYIASMFGNSAIPLSEIIEVGFGVAIYR
ncbi:MAG: hypothetical protein QME58_09810 [Bacteroidota bacterium]|nr:hypothetical protein [Bacteroidota bacterium]